MLFPVVVIDDFFKDPFKIRDFALQQSFYDCSELSGNWPGKRTKSLYELDAGLANEITAKILSVFYGTTAGQRMSWGAHLAFQLIEPMNNPINRGWIHRDDCIAAGVIYLTRHDSEVGGTSIYKTNDYFACGLPDNNTKYKQYSNNFKSEPESYYYSAIEKSNSKFTETVRINSVFNRMILFDGNCYHGVPKYNETDEPRLTLVYFINRLNASRLPVPDTRNFSV